MAKKVAKKTAKKTAKNTANTAKSSSAKKYSFLDDVLESVTSISEVSKKGEVRIKRADLKQALDAAFENVAKHAAGGERVRIPVLGTLVRAEVKARKAGKGRNPFTGEEVMVKARPASKKPRWSFPKSMKEMFSNKRNW